MVSNLTTVSVKVLAVISKLKVQVLSLGIFLTCMVNVDVSSYQPTMFQISSNAFSVLLLLNYAHTFKGPYGV